MKTDMIKRKLDNLSDGIRQCPKCPLCKSRKNAVPGEGPIPAKIFFLGEAPGKEEDIQGRPFVGRSGKYFEILLNNMGLSRKEVYITSSVKCRPPKNRKPFPNELKICKENWLNNQIALLNPKLIVLLGKVSLKQLLDRDDNLMEIHGKILQMDNRKCFVTFHPAAAMRFIKMRKEMLKDFKKLKSLAKML